jgi:hypothetical protein
MIGIAVTLSKRKMSVRPNVQEESNSAALRRIASTYLAETEVSGDQGSHKKESDNSLDC